MVKELYLHLLQWSPLRRTLRQLRGRFLSATGHPDPFQDLTVLARKAQADLLLDIGCHHGHILLRLLETGIACPAVAFDPLEDNLKVARAKLNRFPKIRFEQMALSDQDGFARFFLNRNEQTSSLLENASGNLSSFHRDTEHLATLDVPTCRLDTWFARQPEPRPRSIMVKCDTQGAEEKVIRGGIDLFKKHVVAIYTEVMLGEMYRDQSDFASLRGLLEKECGLMLHNVYPCLHDSSGRAVQMDALWIRPSLFVA